MKRDLPILARNEFDLIVVGGGIFGACAAWDATLRGLSVALIERKDFGGATSANSFKVVHGGIRYLQHADLPRIRESSRERRTLLRIAPHLVEPLPFVIPTFGRGMEGRGVLRIGGWLYDMLTIDRNSGLHDPGRHIPAIHSISRGQCLELYPGLDARRLTGAVVFHDAQIYNPPRLTLSFLRSANVRGAEIANYVEAMGFIKRHNRITGVTVRDVLNGESFEIRGKVILNAAGPWVPGLLEKDLNLKLRRPPTFSRDACFVVNKQLLPTRAALAVKGRTSDPDAIVSRSRRHLFLVPWRDYTLVGVWHVVHQGNPDDFFVSKRELCAFIDEINEAYPPLNLTMSDVSLCNAGLVLFGDKQRHGENLSFGKRSRIIDHYVEHGIDGLISLIGVRYTIARDAARRTIDIVYNKLGRKAPDCRTNATAVYGGDIESIADFMREESTGRPELIRRDVMQGLLRNYGTAYKEVVQCGNDGDGLWQTLADTKIVKAQVVHAVRHEMAQKLSDAVCRRTDLATGAYPSDEVVAECADLMAGEMGWNSAKIEAEVSELRSEFGRLSGIIVPHCRAIQRP